MSYTQWAESDTEPWDAHNTNMTELGQAFVFAHRSEGDSGLNVGYHGGRFDVNTVADGAVACTDNATNYLVVNRSTRAVSAATTTTNWDDTATYGRMGVAVFASGVLTYHDERRSPGGIFDRSPAASGSTSWGDITGTLADQTDLDAALDAKAGTSQVDQWCVFIGSPSDKSYTIVLDCKFACTINEVTTKSASGTCTLTTKINSTALGGTANSVSSTEQTQSHGSSNSVAAGDDVVLTVSSNSSCADMSVTIKYTRTLAA